MVSEEYKRGGGEIQRILGVNGSRYVSSIQDVADKRLSAENSWWQAFLRSSARSGPEGEGPVISALDWFSGCGGLSLGVREAVGAFGCQWASIGAVDVDRSALDLYQYNLDPSFTLNADVSSLVDYMVLGSGQDARFAYFPEIIHGELAG